MTQTDFITQSLIAYVAAHDSDVDVLQEDGYHFSEYSKDKQAALLKRAADEAQERWLLLPADLRGQQAGQVVPSDVKGKLLQFTKEVYLEWVNRSHCKEDLAARFGITVEALHELIMLGRLVNENKFYS